MTFKCNSCCHRNVVQNIVLCESHVKPMRSHVQVMCFSIRVSNPVRCERPVKTRLACLERLFCSGLSDRDLAFSQSTKLKVLLTLPDTRTERCL